MDDDLKQRAYQLLGNSIKKKRIEMGFTQEQLGESVGYGELTRRQAISQIERGAISIPNKRINTFIENLKLDGTFYQQVNYFLSIGNYTEAIEMMQDRERKEKEIAVEMPPIVSDEITTSHHTTYASPVPPTFVQSVSKEEEKKIEYEAESSLPLLGEIEEKLQMIKILLEKGFINEQDFEAKKRDILNLI